jgi:phosphate transport system substrate-binding protein
MRKDLRLSGNNNKKWAVMSFVIMLIFLESVTLYGCYRAEETAIESETEDATEEAGKMFEGQDLNISGSTTILPIATLVAEAFMDEYGGSVTISGGGSGTGISEAINGLNDIGNASRAVKDKEIEEAADLGVELVEVVIAIDAICVMTSGNITGVDDLTIEQLSDIFRGEITSWNKVGGPDAQIVLASRDSSSGTYEYFLERVVQIDKEFEDYTFASTSLALQSNADVVSTVADNDDTIGYIGLGYLQEAVDGGARLINVDGVEPSLDTARSGEYPISRQLYNYYRKDNLSDMGQAYLDFLLSDEGQVLAKSVGFVPLP